MRIAVYGGGGTIGSRIVAEALSRGHEVTIVTRTAPAATPAGALVTTGDAADADAVARVAAGSDVVVSAIGPSRTGGRPQEFLRAIDTLARNVGPRRLVVVGGAGLLFVAPGLRSLDTPDFPANLRMEASTQLAALEHLRAGGGFVDWVYISPAPVTRPGARTGRYRVGSDMVIGDHISAEDYAVAVVDEIEQPRHRREQFTVSS